MRMGWYLVAVSVAALVAVVSGCASSAPAPRNVAPDDNAQSPSAASSSQTAAGGPAATPAQPPESTSPSPRSPAPTEDSLKEELKRAPFDEGDWKTNFRKRSVRLNDFLGGGPPKDGIPALTNPSFVTVKEADKWLEDPEAVEVVEISGDVRAYPQQVMMWHEIVNDVVGGEPVTVTF